ncbi:MAG: hypothetical protein ACOYOU_16250 [Kiritimatiellia bacterium]
MKKKAKSQAVAVMTERDMEQAKTKSETIATTVRTDMQVAESGMFHALRAGVGMLHIKNLYEHGDWGHRLIELFPDRDPRTLRRYMQVGNNFLEAKQIAPLDAWVGMQALRTDRLLAAPESGLMRSKDKVNPLERDVREFVSEFGSIRKAVKGEDDEEGAPGRPLTKAERLEAARDIWNKIAGLAQDELNRGSAGLLCDEDLDGLAAVLRTVSDTLRKQLAQRTTKI